MSVRLEAALKIWTVRPKSGRMATLHSRALSLGLFTPGHLMRFLWSDSYPIVKRPVLRIRNAFETDFNLIAQTNYVWDAFQTKLNTCKSVRLCYRLYDM